MQFKNILLCIIFLCAGCSPCSQGDLVEKRYLPDGSVERVSYSFFYTAQEIVIPGVLGTYLDVDQHEKKVIPFLYLLQKYTGTLGHDDWHSNGLCRGALINLSQEPLDVEVVSLKCFNQELLNNSLTLRLGPQNGSAFFMKDIDIGTYDTKQEFTFTINYQGQQYVKNISLPRLTNEDWIKEDANSKRFKKQMEDNNMTYAEYFYMRMNN